MKARFAWDVKFSERGRIEFKPISQQEAIVCLPRGRKDTKKCVQKGREPGVL